jgi:hypothetical protein
MVTNSDVPSLKKEEGRGEVKKNDADPPMLKLRRVKGGIR